MSFLSHLPPLSWSDPLSPSQSWSSVSALAKRSTRMEYHTLCIKMKTPISLNSHSSFFSQLQRWSFSTAFSPVETWAFQDSPHLSNHLKNCRYNIKYKQLHLTFQVIFQLNIDWWILSQIGFCLPRKSCASGFRRECFRHQLIGITFMWYVVSP